MKVSFLLIVLATFCILASAGRANSRASLETSPSVNDPAPSGSLIEFMQQHQKAYQAEQAGDVTALEVSNVPAPAAPVQQQQPAEQTPHLQSLIQTQATAAEGEPFGSCKTCVFVLERIKKGTNMLLPAICSELYHKYPDAYALCHQVLNALSVNGNNVRYWLFEGCFKYEIYQSKEWIKPCPSHVMCSVLKDLASKPFCPALPMEDPFKDAAGGDAAGGGGGDAAGGDGGGE